jgi:hypothetical protein
MQMKSAMIARLYNSPFTEICSCRKYNKLTLQNSKSEAYEVISEAAIGTKFASSMPNKICNNGTMAERLNTLKNAAKLNRVMLTNNLPMYFGMYLKNKCRNPIAN